jgi:hypothetical protein
MIKISKEKHNELMSVVFDEDSMSRMFMWLDGKIGKLNNSMEVEKELIRIYLTLPDGKSTKALVYQLLVLNGVIDDGVYSKDACNNHGKCAWLKYYRNENPSIDIRLICWNLNVCLLFPDLNIQTPLALTTKEYVELDDSILKKK